MDRVPQSEEVVVEAAREGFRRTLELLADGAGPEERAQFAVAGIGVLLEEAARIQEVPPSAFALAVSEVLAEHGC